MTHKKIICTLLALFLLMSLCACSQPRLFSSERLDVEIRGEGSKTLTVKLMGPSNSLYTCEINGPEAEGSAYAIKSTKTGEDETKLKLTGTRAGADSLIVTYMDGEEEYAITNITLNIDENLKFGNATVIVLGEDRFESLGEGTPEGSQVTKEEGSSKQISLPSEAGPWTVEKYDSDFVHVEEYGYSEESKCYEFVVSAVASGSGSVYLTNVSEGQRVCVDFTVTSVVSGDTQSLVLELTDTATSVYSRSDSEEYAEASGSVMEDIRKFSPDVFIPASAELMGCGSEEGYLEVSMSMNGDDLEYLLFKDVAVKDELALYKEEFPAAETDSFETNGISVNIIQIEDYAVAIWEKDSLLCELFMINESGIDIYRAGDIVEAFLSDTAL